MDEHNDDTHDDGRESPCLISRDSSDEEDDEEGSFLAESLAQFSLYSVGSDDADNNPAETPNANKKKGLLKRLKHSYKKRRSRRKSGSNELVDDSIDEHDDDDDEDEEEDNERGTEEGSQRQKENDKGSSPTKLERNTSEPVVYLPSFEGLVWKKCRRQGDDRPWKKRWFMLCSGSLLYHHNANKKDAVRLFTHLSPKAKINPCEAPNGFGVMIRTEVAVLCFSSKTKEERDKWMVHLKDSCMIDPIKISEEYDLQVNGSTILRVKAALYSAFATSRLGKHLIRRYLDPCARDLISYILEFAELQTSAKKREKLETYIFDVAARVAVILHHNLLPAGLNVSALYDDTTRFCQLFIRTSRDRRLEVARNRAVMREGDEERKAFTLSADPDALLHVMERVTTMWRNIIIPNVKPKIIERYDYIIGSLFLHEHLDAIFNQTSNRELMGNIEKCLRELMELYQPLC